jgi:hypothetical protein
MNDYIYNPEPDHTRNDELEAEIEQAWVTLDAPICKHNDIIKYTLDRIGSEHFDDVFNGLEEFRRAAIEDVACGIDDEAEADQFIHEAKDYVLWMNTAAKYSALKTKATW